jgi:hypothetical protein
MLVRYYSGGTMNEKYEVLISLPPNVFDSKDKIKWLFQGALNVLGTKEPDQVEASMRSVLVDCDKGTIRMKIGSEQELDLFGRLMMLIGTIAGVRGVIQRGDQADDTLKGFLSGWGLEIETEK